MSQHPPGSYDTIRDKWSLSEVLIAHLLLEERAHQQQQGGM